MAFEFRWNYREFACEISRSYYPAGCSSLSLSLFPSRLERKEEGRKDSLSLSPRLLFQGPIGGFRTGRSILEWEPENRWRIGRGLSLPISRRANQIEFLSLSFDAFFLLLACCRWLAARSFRPISGNRVMLARMAPSLSIPSPLSLYLSLSNHSILLEFRGFVSPFHDARC